VSRKPVISRAESICSRLFFPEVRNLVGVAMSDYGRRLMGDIMMTYNGNQMRCAKNTSL
jgi:hypothetical protein